MAAVVAASVCCAPSGTSSRSSVPPRGRVHVGLARGRRCARRGCHTSGAACSTCTDRSTRRRRPRADGFVKATPEDGLDGGGAFGWRRCEAAFRTSERRLDASQRDAGQACRSSAPTCSAATSSTHVAADLAASARRLDRRVNVKSVGDAESATVDRADLDEPVAGSARACSPMSTARKPASRAAATPRTARAGIAQRRRRSATAKCVPSSSASTRHDRGRDRRRHACSVTTGRGGTSSPCRTTPRAAPPAATSPTTASSSPTTATSRCQRSAARRSSTPPRARRTARCTRPKDYRRRYSRFDVEPRMDQRQHVARPADGRVR